MIHRWSILSSFNDARRQGRQQLTRAELRAYGVTREVVDAAVRSGELKEGVHGCWRPRPSDPGFLAVVDAIMGNRDDQGGNENHAIETDRMATAGPLAGRFGQS